jgi:hypothetical protein
MVYMHPCGIGSPIKIFTHESLVQHSNRQQFRLGILVVEQAGEVGLEKIIALQL